MRKHLTLTKMLFATAPAAIVALGFMTADVMAGSSTRDGKHRLADAAAHAAHRAHATHREFVRGFGGSVHGAVPQIVTTGRGSGYYYMPGRGIVDEACNLPTSACPNEQRDIQ
jgi:hypothetical protein